MNRVAKAPDPCIGEGRISNGSSSVLVDTLAS
jgi:hypothetical protein